MVKPLILVLVVAGALSVSPVLFRKNAPPGTGTAELALTSYTVRLLNYTVTVGLELNRLTEEPTVKPDQPIVACSEPDTIFVAFPTRVGREP